MRRTGFSTARVREFERRWDPIQGREVYVAPATARTEPPKPS